MTDEHYSRRQSLGLLASTVPLAAAAQQPSQPSRGRVSVKDFGARGDGITDDTPAFQSALNTGFDVYVPGTIHSYLLHRTLATRRAGQSLTGDGHASFLLQRGEGNNATIVALIHPDCTIADLRLRPGIGGAPLYEGWGVVISGVAGCTVWRCRFEGLRRGGVLARDAERAIICDNRFVDGIVRADGQLPQSEMGYDILIGGTSSRCIVASNECVSGCGTGIGCQTITDGTSQSGNVVRANVIRDHPCYGIMVYLSGSSGRIDGVVIAGNTVANISGSVRTGGRSYFYGAGIYVQTANDFLIEGNYVSSTNTDRRLPPSGSAVPAAIAVSGRGNGTIATNLIRDCIDGIASIQATGPTPIGEGTAIVGNVINQCGRIGINLSDCAAATVTGNRLTGDVKAAHGIFVWRTSNDARLSDFVIASNFVDHFHVGIEVIGSAIARAVVNGNVVSRSIGYAIACGAIVSTVTDNIANGGRGIGLTSSGRNGQCRGNVVEATGPGIVRDATSGVTVADNIVSAGLQEVPR